MLRRVPRGATVERLNALHDAAHGPGWPGAGARSIPPWLTASRAACATSASLRDVVPARPEAHAARLVFPARGVDGMTDPFFLETLVAGSVLPFERPFVVAHEWSHLAGIADEGEANFMGWLTCLRGSRGEQVQRLVVSVRRAGARGRRGAIARRFRRRSRPGRATICAQSGIATFARSTRVCRRRAGGFTIRT